LLNKIKVIQETGNWKIKKEIIENEIN